MVRARYGQASPEITDPNPNPLANSPLWIGQAMVTLARSGPLPHIIYGSSQRLEDCMEQQAVSSQGQCGSLNTATCLQEVTGNWQVAGHRRWSVFNRNRALTPLHG